MVKVSSAKAITALKSVLILLAGIIGAKTLKGLVQAKFPQYAQYTNYGVLAAALVGTMATKPIVASVGKGALLFASVQLLNQFAPGSASKYIPQISGLGNLQLPIQSAYQFSPESVTLGEPSYGMGDASSFVAG